MDIDSSDEDNSGSCLSLTTSSVLLGYATKTATEDPINQLGGLPAWPDPAAPPSADLVKCKHCQGFLCMLLQLNGDLPERFKDQERRIYIFSCRQSACRRKDGCVRVLRGVRHSSTTNASRGGKQVNGQKQPKPSPQKSTPMNLGDSIFGVGNPFSTSSLLGTSTTQASSNNDVDDKLSDEFAQNAKISSTSPVAERKSQTAWPSTPAFPTAYPSFFLEAEFETLEPATPSQPPILDPKMEMVEDIDTPGLNSATNEADAADSNNVDQTFIRFADRIAQNAEQVLRYEFSGTPLLYSRADEVGKRYHAHPTTSQILPSCTNCNAARVFEVQLVPHAITVLEQEDGKTTDAAASSTIALSAATKLSVEQAKRQTLEGMDWGTILVGVCERNCAEAGVTLGQWGWLEEWVGVQWEEDVSHAN